MAAVSYAHENVPPGMKATVQGLLNAVVEGFGIATGGFLGGLLLEHWGGRTLYFVFGILVLATVTIIAKVNQS